MAYLDVRKTITCLAPPVLSFKLSEGLESILAHLRKKKFVHDFAFSNSHFIGNFL